VDAVAAVPQQATAMAEIPAPASADAVSAAAAEAKRVSESAAAAAGLLGLSCAISARGEVLPLNSHPPPSAESA
jgi:hypothetical protein